MIARVFCSTGGGVDSSPGNAAATSSSVAPQSRSHGRNTFHHATHPATSAVVPTALTITDRRIELTSTRESRPRAQRSPWAEVHACVQDSDDG